MVSAVQLGKAATRLLAQVVTAGMDGLVIPAASSAAAWELSGAEVPLIEAVPSKRKGPPRHRATVAGLKSAGALTMEAIYQPPWYLGEVVVPITDLRRTLDHDETDLSPSYQRDSVWTDARRAAFVGHVISGGETMALVIQRSPDGGRAEVLDGKQRIEAVYAWLDGKVPAQLPNGVEVWIGELRRDERGRVPGLMRVGLMLRYIDLPWRERKRFYVNLNSGGTPHTPEDIAHALAAEER